MLIRNNNGGNIYASYIKAVTNNMHETLKISML